MDNPIDKYSPFVPIDLKNRKWPGKTIKQAPIWCSVDLRDIVIKHLLSQWALKEKIECLIYCVN